MSEHPMTAPPRDLTDEERQAEAEWAHQCMQRIMAAKAEGVRAMWTLAKNLHEFNERAGWAALGYETQSEWLADPDIQLTRALYAKLVHSYRETVVRRQIPLSTMETIDHSKVPIVLGRVNKGEVKIEDALEDARTLGARDLREKYFGEQIVDTSPQSPEDGRGLDDLNAEAIEDLDADDADVNGNLPKTPQTGTFGQVSESLPTLVGLCPDPEHTGEFYVADPEEEGICPQPGCTQVLVRYRRES